MCNLYTLRLSEAELTEHFGAARAAASNAGEEVYPGTPGMVVREAEGQRIMQSMTWGFGPFKRPGVSVTLNGWGQSR